MDRHLFLWLWVIVIPAISGISAIAGYSNTTTYEFSDGTYISLDQVPMDTCEYEVDSAGEICCNSSGCGPGYDPGLIFEVSPPTGGTGNYVYMWLVSELRFDQNGNFYWTPPVPLLNPDGTLYDGRELAPGPLDVSTRYRRCVSTRECIEAGFNFFMETNIVTIEVLDCNCMPSNGGEIAEDQSTCEESIDPDTLISIREAVPADPNDPILYQWYFNYSNTAFDRAIWVEVNNATDPFYDPPVTDRDIYYIRLAYNPFCRNDYVISNVVAIDVGIDINVIEFVTNPLCHDSDDGKIRLDVNTPHRPFDLEWDHTSSTTDTLCDLGPGSYRYTVTNDKGCEYEGEIEVTAPDSINIEGDVEGNLCAGVANGSIDITVTGGTPPYRYMWSTGFSEEDLDSLREGQYCVTVTDDHDCEAEACFDIAPMDTLDIMADIDSVSCYGECDGSIDITVTGGTAPYMYMWDDGPITEDRDSLKAGEYCVKVTDDNGCMVEECFEVGEPDSLKITGVVEDAVCYGDCNGSIDVTVMGGTPPYTFMWDDGPTTEDRDSLKAGEYCLKVTDANGCMDEECFIVDEGDSIIVSLPDTIYKCPGDSIVFLNPDGSSDYEYSWSPPDLVSDPTAVNPFTCPENDTCIFVVVTDPETGCFTERKIVIIVGDFPDFDLPDVVVACDSFVEICTKDFPDYDIDWACDIDFIDTLEMDTCVLINVFEKDVIYFRAIDSLDCEYIDSIPIDNQVIKVSYADTISFCEGDTVMYKITDVYGNIDDWIFDCLDFIVVDEENGCLFLSYDTDTIVECMFTVSNQFCTETFTFVIEVFENDHNVTATADPTDVNKGLMTMLMASSPNDDDTFIWSPDQYLLDPVTTRNPKAMPEESITYTVLSEDSKGCTAIDSVRINYTCICDDPFIFIPNAFTPNDDGLNDTYNVVTEDELVEDMYLAVYNRWGELVFQTTSLSNSWDGYHNGDLVNPDVYAYYVRIKCFGNEEEFTKRGNVTVLY